MLSGAQAGGFYRRAFMAQVTADAIRAAVQAQRQTMAVLFDRLRQDGLDEPGVSRDPYGDGEQRAHAMVARPPRPSDWRSAATMRQTFT